MQIPEIPLVAIDPANSVQAVSTVALPDSEPTGSVATSNDPEPPPERDPVCPAQAGLSDDDARLGMRWLLEHRRALANESLCCAFDVACYLVGDSCFDDTASPEDRSKWFVSVVVSSGLNCEEIPLADSRAQAQQLAVTHLDLVGLFFEKPRWNALPTIALSPNIVH